MLFQTFLKLFPPPKFLDIPHAGLDISDDAVRCVQYKHGLHGLYIDKYGERKLPQGMVESGFIKDEQGLSNILFSLKEELKIDAVKVSLPEERMYLFKTEVLSMDEKEARQGIEFKLEENVPLTPDKALFFFDFIPNIKEGKIFASVSVAPRKLIDIYLETIRKAHLQVISFEIQPKAISRAIIPLHSKDTHMILHIMEHKTGVYIVFAGVVCFTSTISWGAEKMKNSDNKEESIKELKKEINRVYTYWTEHGEGTNINQIVLSGKSASTDGLASYSSPDPKIPVKISNVWENSFSIDDYIPPISFENSLDYVIAIGLAL